jgi:hypothetical protein
MLTCQCGSTFLKKNKTQHINTLKHKTWLKDEEYVQRLDREMAQLIIDANTIEPKMESSENHLENGENKEPLIIENPPIRLPEKVNINIHCNRCNELKLALQVIGISMGITSFALVLWLIAKK